MTKRRHLDAEAQSFFANTLELAFGNPFSPDRSKLENRVASKRGHASKADRLQSLADALSERLQALRLTTTGDSEQFREDDALLIHNALVLRTYYQHANKFDAHIEAQQLQNAPLAALCARDTLKSLLNCGFPQPLSLRYVEVFFQLRRALYFIHTEITGASPAVVELRMRLWNTLFTIEPQWYLKYLCGRMQDFSTLLLGETGTGKTAAARVIGYSAYIPFDLNTGRFRENFAEAFLAINLAEYPASLIESQLFGHRKGAFTGAIDQHQGLFARCSEFGTVFIDEIGDVDLPTQTKLLRVLQEREFTPVGSQQALRFLGRVVAATNKDLDSLRRADQFRDDFYYRLCSDVIVVPPLRQRLAEDPAELGRIVNTVIRRAIGEHTEPLAERVEERIKALLPRDYAWPGNIRELEQCIRRICITGNYSGDSKALGNVSTLTNAIESGKLTANEMLSVYCRQLYNREGSYERVAQLAGLDRRTVKRYVEQNKAVPQAKRR